MALPAMQSGLYIADSNTAPLIRSAQGFNHRAPLVIIPAGDNHKTFDSLTRIISAALHAGLDRSSVFLAVGGGMVCDIAACAASLYMRGVDCVLVPTSLLAMVDAAIGGKTAVNVCGVKNAAGTFYHARSVHIFTDALNSLPEQEYRSGLAEVLKTALLYDNGLRLLLEKNHAAIDRRDARILLQIIRMSVQTKAGVVSRDVTDKGERRCLNFGHTFAHALESLCDFSILHGDAVGWGMVRALRLGVTLGITDTAYAEYAVNLIGSYGFCTQSVYPAAAALNHRTIKHRLVEYMRNDKKNSNSAITVILQRHDYTTEVHHAACEAIMRVL